MTSYFVKKVKLFTFAKIFVNLRIFKVTNFMPNFINETKNLYS